VLRRSSQHHRVRTADSRRDQGPTTAARLLLLCCICLLLWANCATAVAAAHCRMSDQPPPLGQGRAGSCVPKLSGTSSAPSP
jgi:hypothetical protein